MTTATVTTIKAITIIMAEQQEPQGVEEPFVFWRSRRWWRAWLVTGFGPMFWVFVVISIMSGSLVWWLRGEQVFLTTLSHDLEQLADIAPRVALAVAAAGALWVLLPREKLGAMLSSDRGVMGLMLATAAGMVTPGGPTAAFALLAMIGGFGADRGMMVAYIASWATMGLQRILTWDVPMMGADFSILRFASTLPLPVLAGLLARALPVPMTLKAETRLRDRM